MAEETAEFSFRLLKLLLEEGLSTLDFLLHGPAFEEGSQLMSDTLSIFVEVVGENLSDGIGVLCFGEFLAQFLVTCEVSEDGTAEGTHNEGKFLHGGQCSSVFINVNGDGSVFHDDDWRSGALRRGVA